MENPIYIIGYGAVGMALAVALKLAGKNVIILRGRPDNSPGRVENIQVAIPGKPLLEAKIEINTLNNFEQLDGIIVLTTKSYGNKQLAQTLKSKAGNSPIVLLQNGLGVEQPFIETGFTEIYRCVLFITSVVIAPGKVNYKPVAVSPIGVVANKSTSLNNVIEALDNAYLPFKAEYEIETIIWKKAIANSVFNSICPLLNIDNGIFKRDASALLMAKRIITECVGVAQAKGIMLTVDEVTESVLQISKLSDGQLISTLQDINNNRPTEIDTLNLQIVEIAKTLNMEIAVQQTLLLGELIKLKSGF
ncbi:ketopantoate reductase family protein [Mucilaginibacter jinjuensis]|uniref:2-dehydropantoate 2-reductase n=1 Tax=Mucilaginibacter jinjuensis TaxID=1176721 RepID=A0ABY7T1Y0_9SPHI|nr:2-dehydropantoate 2-reductase [Mucilaginibacter jinjuensis]WCT10331.1 2-dehydropantoate 2-reductase [Mucilaginibacter jinjuensis]